MKPTYLVTETGKRSRCWLHIARHIFKYGVIAAILVYLLLLALWAAKLDGYIG